jgi:hypothetical protein
MRLYGALQELTSLVIRLASGKTVKIQAAEQAAAGETTITIPDVVDGADTVVLVDTQQTLTNKTLTSPTLTNAAINSTSKVVIPSQNSPSHTEAGSLIWDGNDSLLTVGSGGMGYKVMVDLDSSQTLFQKTISGGSLSGGTVVGGAVGVVGSPTSINNISKLAMGDIGASVGANHVVITNANKEAITEATLSKARGGAGADMTNVVFPATGTLVTEDGSQTLSNKTIGTVTAASGTMTISGTGALRLPLGTEANRPAGTAATLKGMIRYNDEADAFEGYNELSGWSSLGGGGTTDRVTQASHGFVVGEVLYLNGSTYAKALATAANTAEVVGVVSRVIDASTFELTLSGEISGLSGLTPGEVYFLDASTPGAITIVEPSVVGQVSLPVGVASSASTLYVAPKRGVVVGAANARTTISVSNNAATNVVSVANYNSLKLEGELNVTRSSGGNQRAYYTVEAAKNGAGVWQVSASYTGDDVLYTTLPSWDVASNNLQVTMPLVTNFSSASLTYSLNAPAVGASLPLSIDSSSLNVVDSAPLSYRNLIINGNFDVWQRGTTGTAGNTTTGDYVSADRWKAYGIEDTVAYGRCTVAQSTDVPSGSRYSAKLSATTAGTDRIGVAQYIEAANVAAIASQTVTVSVKIKKLALYNSGSPIEIGLYYMNAADTGASNLKDATGLTLIQSYNHTPSGSGWETVSFSATLPANAANGLCLRFNYTRTDMGAGEIFAIAQVQLEVGSKASAFERRPYSEELARCQRYFLKETLVANGLMGFVDTTALSIHYLTFRTEMRAAPNTLSSSGTFELRRGGGVATAVSALVLAGQSSCGARLNATASSANLTVGQGVALVSTSAAEVYLAFSAEL